MKKISFDVIRRRGLQVWIRHYKLLFVFLFLALTSFVSSQWYQNLYRYSWTPEQRKEYLESTVKETAFQEEKFTNVLKKLEASREARSDAIELSHDLFAGARKKKDR